MTSLPAPSLKKLGLVIDLDICVGCHACAVACKEWNEGGQFGPLDGNRELNPAGLFIQSSPSTIYAGSNEIQRNILAKNVLELPG